MKQAHTHENMPTDAQGHVKTCPYTVTQKHPYMHTRTCRNMQTHTQYICFTFSTFSEKYNLGRSECFRLQAVYSSLSRRVFKFASKLFVRTSHLNNKNENSDSGTDSNNDDSNKNKNNILWSEQISIKYNISSS